MHSRLQTQESRGRVWSGACVLWPVAPCTSRSNGILCLVQGPSMASSAAAAKTEVRDPLRATTHRTGGGKVHGQQLGAVAWSSLGHSSVWVAEVHHIAARA